MELRNVYYHLHALKQLYSLLQCDGSRNSITNSANFLDERARALLKNMIDDAAARILESGSMVMASLQSGGCKRSFSSSCSMLPRVMENMKSPESPSAIQVGQTDPSFRKVGGWKDEQSLLRPKQEFVVSDLSKPGISLHNAASRKNRRCRICQQRMQEMENSNRNLLTEGNSGDESQNGSYWINEHAKELVVPKQKLKPNTGDDQEKRVLKLVLESAPPSEVGSAGGASAAVGTDFGEAGPQCLSGERVIKTDRKASDFSEEVDVAIRSIECGISFFEPFPENSDCPSHNEVEENDLITVNEVHPAKGPNVEAKVNRIESMSRGTDQNNEPMRSVANQHNQGLRFPPSQVAEKPSVKPVKIDKLNRVNDSMNHLEKKIRPSMLARSIMSTTSGHKKKPLPRPTIRPTLEDFEDRWKSEIQVGFRLDQMHESDGKTSSRSGSYSSSSTSQQEASSSSRSTNNSSSRSIGDNSRGTGSRSRTGSIGSSSVSVNTNDEDSESLSDLDPPDRGESSRKRYRSQVHRPHNLAGPSKRYRSESSGKKTIGRLRKLKNKLGLIFHHHHHHHHHHRHHHHHHHVAKEDKEEDEEYNDSDGRHNKSMWKLNNIFHHKGKHKRQYEKEAVERLRLRKSVISNKRQTGHFRRLVQGLMNHVKHSNKPRHSRIAGNGKSGHENEQRWKMLKQRRGLKMPKKGRVRLGYRSRKPQRKST